jgi:phage tail sheath gpL-like
MSISFNFTRNPSVKVAVQTVVKGLTQADDTLILIGHRAAAGGTAVTGVPVSIANYGDPVLAQTECDGLFGAAAEISDMVVAAIKAVLFSDLVSKKFPPIKVIPIANGDTSANLAATLAANITLPMPFVAIPYAITDATARTALRDHLTAISASDRGQNGQFGSFGFIGTLGTLAAATPAGESAASETILSPWLRDAGAAQSLPKVTAGVAAIAASGGVPFYPMNDVKVGGLVPPAAVADYHSSGDAGTVSLGLTSGLIPLTVGADGSVRISRMVTTRRPVAGTPEVAYYDMQDWQALYYYRKNAYVLASQPRYKIAKATDSKLRALRSELIAIAKTFEALEIFQNVDDLVKSFTVTRDPANRHAAVYGVPVNVVPGFHNKGIGVEGTTEFDSFSL